MCGFCNPSIVSLDRFLAWVLLANLVREMQSLAEQYGIVHHLREEINGKESGEAATEIKN